MFIARRSTPLRRRSEERKRLDEYARVEFRSSERRRVSMVFGFINISLLRSEESRP
jgi:hypothetical protein